MDWQNQVIHLGSLAAAITAILALGGILVKWGIVKPIKTYIEHMTYTIQPHANGGNSLPDAIRAIQRVEEKLDRHIELDHPKDS